MSQQDDDHEGAVDVDHCLLLRHGAAASKEGHEEDDAAKDDEDDGDVEVGAVEEVQIVPRRNLHVGPQPHDGEASQGEQEVEYQDKILDTAVSTTVHADANSKLFRLNEIEMIQYIS